MNDEFFGEQEVIFQRTVRSFVKKECPGEYVQDCDRNHRPPLDLYQKVARQGWLGVSLPEEYGGSGAGMTFLAILLEELARGMLALSIMVFRASMHGGQALLQYGSPEQRERYLPGLIEGRYMFSFGLTEPNAGSDAASISTAASKAGDSFILNGTKMFTSGAQIADYILVAARTNPEKTKHLGITTFLVDRSAPGLSVTPIEILGHWPIGTTMVFLDSVRVPMEQVVGAVGEGWRVVTGHLVLERLATCACALGGATDAFEEALEYAKQRVQFGQPIGKFQAIQHKLADMHIGITAARLLTYDLARRIDAGESDLRSAASVAKVFVSETYNDVADEALQILGGFGYTLESRAQRHFRDARVMKIGGGTSEIQRNIIAKSLGL